MLTLNEIHTYYGDSHILQGVTMKAEKGEITALMGRNGMGKTTTLHSIMGFVAPSGGEILFEGRNIAGLPPDKIARMGISLVPQGRRIFPSLSVEENLQIGWRKSERKQNPWSPDTLYRWFPALKERAGNRGDSLSGGEQQMLAFGRALVMNPRLLLVDEPFEGLAPEIVKELGNRMGELRDSGMAILLVEQNLRMTLSLADHIYVMNKGRIAYEGRSQMTGEHMDAIHKLMLV